MGAQAFIPRSVLPQEDPGVRDRRQEALALVLLAGTVFLSLALASLRFDPGDPTYVGSDWMGSAGRWMGGVLVRSFGAAAWLVPLEAFLFALPILRGRQVHEPGLRCAGDVLLLVLLAALLQVLLPGVPAFGLGLIGGNVGLLFGELLRGLFSTPGSVLVVSTSVALIWVGRASFSFIEFCESCARLVQKLGRGLRSALARVRLAWSEARLVRREQQAVWEAESALVPPAVYDEELGEWVPFEKTGFPQVSLAESVRSEGDQRRGDDFWGSAFDQDSVPPASAVVHAPSWQILDTELEGELEAPDSLEPEPLDVASGAPSPVVDHDTKEETQEGDGVPEEPRIVNTAPAQQMRAARVRRGREQEPKAFVLPSPELLDEPNQGGASMDRSVLLAHANRLEKTLLDYGVVGKVEEIHPGPTVTTYEVAPSAGTKVSKVSGLSDDLALGLSKKVRIIAPIPGKSRIGFELPNDRRQPVFLRDLIEDERFVDLCQKAPLPIVLGRDIVGAPFYADLSAMPHVIVAGATGAGKSVGLNVMLSSLLFSRTPEELRLLMIDPKVVELAPFDRIPHLLLPVVTDMKQAATALRWAVDEMERRYQLFADAGTKNIQTYNRYVERVQKGELPARSAKEVLAVTENGDITTISGAKEGGDGVELPERLPFIVIVVDEFADLMMQQGKEVEASVARLAQKARAAGMHVILATQRPSVDVITGMIKANFPTRIAFRVAQKVDSRTILDEQGAEVLLGRGDMLVKLNGAPDTLRVQCPFVSEEEVSALTDHLRAQAAPQYQEAILIEPDADDADEDEEQKVDARFEEAVLIVRDTQRCSTSWLQRKMTIGYNRAAKIVETMEKRGYVGPPNGSKDREVLLPP